MAKDSDHLAGALDADKAGLLTGLFAEENEFDRRALWRIGTWGVVAVGAVALAVTANQWSEGLRRDQVAAADLSRQSQQIQSLSRQSQNETRRLANAIDTLNNDRDRLFSRITVLEQGLDSVTGTVAKQAAAASAVAAPKPPPSVAPPPATVMAPSVPLADSPPQSQASNPVNPPKQAATPTVAPLTNLSATQPVPVDKPRAETAKPDPASAAMDALSQFAATRTASATPSPAAQPAPAETAIQPLGAAKSMMGPPDPAAPKLVEPVKAVNATPAAAPSPTPAPASSAAADITATVTAKDQDKVPADAEANADTEASRIQRTEFAVELGGANSISGLRALWRGLVKSNNAELAELRPIIVLREANTGLGMQLRLAAGPLPNAADAAKICASLVESKRACETTVFDGQRLAMAADDPPKPGPAPKSTGYGKRYYPKRARKDDPPAPAPKPETSTSSFSSLLSLGKH